jgi:hypothetical protein
LSAHFRKSCGGSIINNRGFINRTVLAILVVGLAFVIRDAAQGGSSAVTSPLPATADSLTRQVTNDAFGLGERLKFSIGYGPITAGTAWLEVLDTNSYEGRLCYKISSHTSSNGFFDSFYKVRDTIVSQLDVDGLFSRYFFKVLHEGSYHSSREIVLDHATRRAFFRKGNDKPDTVALLPFANDELSVLYYARTQPLKIGTSIRVPAISGDTSQMIEVRVLGRETVEVPAGVFKCLVVEPMLVAAGVFKQEGAIKVWLTDDRLRMPVLMKSKVLVGSIFAELEEYKLGNLDW